MINNFLTNDLYPYREERHDQRGQTPAGLLRTRFLKNRYQAGQGKLESIISGFRSAFLLILNFNPELLGIILLTISLLINFALRLIQKRGNVGSKG